MSVIQLIRIETVFDLLVRHLEQIRPAAIFAFYRQKQLAAACDKLQCSAARMGWWKAKMANWQSQKTIKAEHHLARTLISAVSRTAWEHLWQVPSSLSATWPNNKIFVEYIVRHKVRWPAKCQIEDMVMRRDHLPAMDFYVCCRRQVPALDLWLPTARFGAVYLASLARSPNPKIPTLRWGPDGGMELFPRSPREMERLIKEFSPELFCLECFAFYSSTFVHMVPRRPGITCPKGHPMILW